MEDSGYIDLYFGNQSHFGLTSNLSCAPKTKENSLMLPAAKGKYPNLVGLMMRKNKLYFEILDNKIVIGLIQIIKPFVKVQNKT